MKTEYVRHNWRAWLAIAALPVGMAGIMLSLQFFEKGQYETAGGVFFLFLLVACLLSVGWFHQLASRGNPPLAATSMLPSADWYPPQCIAHLQQVKGNRRRAKWGIGGILAVMLLHGHIPVFTGSFDRLPYVVDGGISTGALMLKIASVLPMALLFGWATLRYDHAFRLHYRWKARRHDAFRDPEVVAEAQYMYDSLRLASPLRLRPRPIL